jgi:hypothetical protein
MARTCTAGSVSTSQHPAAGAFNGPPRATPQHIADIGVKKKGCQHARRTVFVATRRTHNAIYSTLNHRNRAVGGIAFNRRRHIFRRCERMVLGSGGPKHRRQMGICGLPCRGLHWLRNRRHVGGRVLLPGGDRLQYPPTIRAEMSLQLCRQGCIASKWGHASLVTRLPPPFVSSLFSVPQSSWCKTQIAVFMR